MHAQKLVERPSQTRHAGSAYLLLRTADFTGIACNEEYKRISLSPELVRDGVEGRHLIEFAPLTGAQHFRDYVEVAERGGVKTGVDYLVGPDGLSRAYMWRATRPTHDVLAIVIECEGCH